MLDSFIAHSSMPVQKIVWAYEGTYNEDNPYWVEEDWTYIKIPFSDEIDAQSILVDGIWTSDNWATSYPANFYGKVGGWAEHSGGGYVQQTESLDVMVGYNYIAIRGLSDYGDEIKFRVWAYMKETDLNSDAPQPDTARVLADNFQKTTDLAQLNLVAEIEHEMTDGQTWTYFHNLGFRPLVRVWRKYHHVDYGETTYGTETQFYVGDEPEGYVYVAPTFHVDDSKITIHSDLPSEYGDAITYLVRIYNYDTTV